MVGPRRPGEDGHDGLARHRCQNLVVGRHLRRRPRFPKMDVLLADGHALQLFERHGVPPQFVRHKKRRTAGIEALALLAARRELGFCEEARRPAPDVLREMQLLPRQHDAAGRRVGPAEQAHAGAARRRERAGAQVPPIQCSRELVPEVVPDRLDQGAALEGARALRLPQDRHRSSRGLGLLAISVARAERGEVELRRRFEVRGR
mmetsp:Transcript_20897/g.54457  ORF Transcript_20897/g.54457 Transcript_20897/m.54457 type:complete len:205 (-) Transcript_20897:101-715(-)